VSAVGIGGNWSRVGSQRLGKTTIWMHAAVLCHR